MILYLLYRIGVFLVLALPLQVAYSIADALGNLYYLLARRDRKIVTNNIKVVLNQSESTAKVRQVSRLVFTNFARYLVEFFRAPKVDLKFVESSIRIEGRENLEQALSLGKGVLLVSAHIGNWELGGMFLSMLGYKMNIVAWTHKNRQINDFFLKQRQSKGVQIIPLGTGIRKAFSVLNNNEIVAFLGDIDYANPCRGIKVRLFNQQTLMPKGPAMFSLKTQAPILPTFMLREKDNKFRMVLEEPIIYKATGNRQDDLTELTARIAKSMESYISLYPEQWFMLTPRW